jgi:hypothetical protein
MKAAKAVATQKAFVDEIKDPANRDAMSKSMAGRVNKVFEDEQAEERGRGPCRDKALAAARELKADGIKGRRTHRPQDQGTSRSNRR